MLKVLWTGGVQLGNRGNWGWLLGGEDWSWALSVGWREESPGLSLETVGQAQEASGGHAALLAGVVGEKEGRSRYQTMESLEYQVKGFSLGAINRGVRWKLFVQESA